MTNLCVRPKRVNFWGDFDKLFGDVLSTTTFRSDLATDFAPSVDIRETDDNIELVFALPGLEKKDIKVTISNNVLTVAGEQKVATEAKADEFVRREIRSGSFSRSFTLPKTVNAEKIAADYKDGLLQIRLDKLEEVKPKQVEVKIS